MIVSMNGVKPYYVAIVIKITPAVEGLIIPNSSLDGSCINKEST